MALAERTIEANGRKVHLLSDGPEDGPLVVFLHGFPELARSWKHQLPALAAAGYHAVAPDMRGYGGTDKEGPWDMRTLAGDVKALVRALGREKAVVVGHDWGGGVAWATAMYEPDVVDRLVILNCPHPAVLAKAILTSPRQTLKSWYMFFFQLPWLPEKLTTLDGARFVARALRGGSTVRSAWPPEETQPYRDSYLQPGAASAAIGYYRAAFRSARGVIKDAKTLKIKARTHVIWGLGDRFLGHEFGEPAAVRACMEPGNEATFEAIEGAGHYVQNEAPERVNEALMRFLGPA
jgi:pimeloyl-ACP methyl ester carboxylesterase